MKKHGSNEGSEASKGKKESEEREGMKEGKSKEKGKRKIETL